MADDDPFNGSDNPFKPSLAILLNKLDPKDGAQIMDYLKTHFLMMREKALLQASVREEKKLLVENAKLKKDIEELKIQLQEKQKRKAAKALAASLAPPSDSPGLSVTPGPSPRVPATQSAAGPSPGQPVTQHDRQGRRRRGDRRARPVSDPGVPAASLALSWKRAVDVSRLDIRVGRVLSVRRHRAAEDLMVQEVDVGETSTRTVVSTLEDNLELEKGALILLLCNIKPCQLKGVVSQARLLCCSAPDGDDITELLAPPPGGVPGDRVTFHNYPGDPDKVLQSKDRIWETLQSDLKTDNKGVACYKGVGFEVRGKGLCRAPTLTNAAIR